MITYRHPRDLRNGRPVTETREQRDPELEHYGWVEVNASGDDVHRGDQDEDEGAEVTGGDGRLDERTDPKSTRHDPEQVEVEKPLGRKPAGGNRIVTKG